MGSLFKYYNKKLKKIPYTRMFHLAAMKFLHQKYKNTLKVVTHFGIAVREICDNLVDLVHLVDPVDPVYLVYLYRPEYRCDGCIW
jgi:hypothetical protein